MAEETGGSVDSRGRALLAEWRGSEKHGHLVVKEDLAKHDVETQMNSLISLAACAVGMVLAGVDPSSREGVLAAVVHEAETFAKEVLGADFESDAVVH